MRDHAATEVALAESVLAFTSLRNGFYAASGVMLLGDAVVTGELAAPEDAPVSWTAHADLAELASRFSGRPVRRVVVSDDDYREGCWPAGCRRPQSA